MAESTKKGTRKTAKSTTATDNASKGFTDEERAAMKARAQELKAEARASVCFFKSAGKFKSRYATLGFEDAANLDDGAMWPTSFALKDLTTKDEAKIAALVKKAAS